MPQSEVDGFARGPIQLLEIRKAQPPNVQVEQSRLAQCEARRSQMVIAATVAIQKPGGFKIHQETVHSTDR
jgi:hypothetical protein